MEGSFETEESSSAKIIRFNDKEFGGYEATDDSGNSILKFDEDDARTDLWLDYEYADHLPDFPNLRSSAQAGCAFCNALRDASLSLVLPKTGYVKLSMYYVWCSQYVAPVGLYLLVAQLQVKCDGTESASTSELIFYADCDEGDVMKWLRAPRSPWPQPLCDESVAWMKGLLHKCSAECCPNPAPGFLPTRLIDLGVSEEADNIRLVHTSVMEPQERLRYAALSYCWGTEDQAIYQLKTTSSTLEQHMNRISFHEMTAIMQDTVKTARALSIRYIWIDALCIIQGDEEEWAKESQQMAGVYSNAFVTVCTPSSSSCLEGFLQRAQPIKIAFQSFLRPTVRGMLNLRHQPVQNSTKKSKPLDLEVFRSSWSSRAWTLQEDRVSTRLLYFGSSHVHHMCRLRYVTEMWSEGTWAESTLNSLNFFMGESRYYGNEHPTLNACKAWRGVVLDYVQCSSTNAKDRFPAIAGLASFVARAAKSTYCAGLWEDTLLQDLLWSTMALRHRQPRYRKEELVRILSDLTPFSYIGPSWSWTHCVRCKFQRFSPEEHEWSHKDPGLEFSFSSECESLDAICTPENPDLNSYGRLQDSKLKVSGKIIRPPSSTWSRVDNGRWTTRKWKVTYEFGLALCDIDWYVDPKIKKIWMEDVSLLLLASSCGSNLHYKYCSNPVKSRRKAGVWYDAKLDEDSDDESSDDEESSDDDESSEDDDPLITDGEIKRDPSDPSDRNAWGLLIQPIENGARYVRVGIFRSAPELGGVLPFAYRQLQEVEIV